MADNILKNFREEWSEKENIQEQLKPCTRETPIWREVSVFYNRDNESCKVRMHMLLTAYKNFNDTKCRSIGTAPLEKSSCCEEINAV